MHVDYLHELCSSKSYGSLIFTCLVCRLSDKEYLYSLVSPVLFLVTISVADVV
jgi:hypothetical protein